MMEGGVGGRFGINKSGMNTIKAKPATRFNYKSVSVSKKRINVQL